MYKHLFHLVHLFVKPYVVANRVATFRAQANSHKPRAPMATMADPEVIARITAPQDFGGVVTCARWIVQRLREAGLAHDMILVPEQLGIHPDNRGKYGINEETVHNLGDDILQVGWNPEEVVSPWCVEDEPTTKYIEKFNIDLAAASEYLAPVSPMTLRAGTLTNSHLVLLLKAIKAGVRSTRAALCVDGKMSLAHVQHVSPGMAEACTAGWKWCMLHHSTKSIYGSKLFSFLSDAKNVRLQRGETEIQVMLKVFNQAAENIPWGDIHRAACRTKPACEDYIPNIIAFVRDFGGGVDAGFVKDLASFHAKHVPNERCIKGNFLDSVTTAKMPSKCPLLRYALLKAEYSCPPAKVFGKECKYISKAEIDSLGKKHAEATAAAEHVLARCRSIVGAYPKVSEIEKVRLFGRLDVGVVRALLNKPGSTDKSVSSEASAFIEHLKEIVGGDSVPNPWGGQLQIESAPTISSSSNPDEAMQQFTITGDHLPTNLMEGFKNAGFEVGADVVPKAKPSDHHVVTGVGSEIVVKRLADSEVTKMSLSKFTSTFTQYGETWYPIVDPGGHEGFKTFGNKAAIAYALSSISSSPQPKVKCMHKPTKKVVSDDDYKAGQLILTPDAMSIMCTRDKTKVSSSAAVVTTNFDDDFTYFVPPPSMSHDPEKKTLVPGYWLVRASSDEKEVNMVCAKATVNVSSTANVSARAPTKSACSAQVEIPILKNKKAVTAGTELVVACPPELSESKPTAKRAKKA